MGSTHVGSEPSLPLRLQVIALGLGVIEEWLADLNTIKVWDNAWSWDDEVG